jgi:hypothetical protein
LLQQSHFIAVREGRLTLLSFGFPNARFVTDGKPISKPFFNESFLVRGDPLPDSFGGFIWLRPAVADKRYKNYIFFYG